MSTLEFVAASADGLFESAAPLVTAPILVSGLGTHPTITVALVCGHRPDLESIRRRLVDPAAFYGIDLPGVAALRAAVQSFLARVEAVHGGVAVAADIMVVEVNAQVQFVVSGSVIEPVRTDPVALTAQAAATVVIPPHWRQMAARTSSRAEADLARRTLAAAGFADAVPVDGTRVGVPLLGALIFDTADGRIGTGAERLALLSEAGLAEAITDTVEVVDVSVVTRAWWVSPRFETHPVAAIGAHRFNTAGAAI